MMSQEYVNHHLLIKFLLSMWHIPNKKIKLENACKIILWFLFNNSGSSKELEKSLTTQKGTLLFFRIMWVYLRNWLVNHRSLMLHMEETYSFFYVCLFSYPVCFCGISNDPLITIKTAVVVVAATAVIIYILTTYYAPSILLNPLQ